MVLQNIDLVLREAFQNGREVLSAEELQNGLKTLRRPIDKVGTITIGLPLSTSELSSEVSVRIAQKVLARGLEALAADIEDDAVGEALEVLLRLLIN